MMETLLWRELLSQRNRLLQLHTVLTDALLVARFQGTEAINQDLAFTLDCLSPAASLDIEQLPGTAVTLQLALNDGRARTWQGVVAQVLALGGDGAVARYRLQVGSWLGLLKQRRNTLIFQGLDALQITARVFADYPLAQWQAHVTQPLVKRALCTQHRETDFEFICRVWSEEGLSFYLDHDAEGGARLLIVDSQRQWPAGVTLPFSRTDAAQLDHGIQRFSEHRQISSDSTVTCSWNAAQLLGVSGSAQATADAGPALPPLQVFDAAPGAVFATEQHAQGSAEQQLGARRLRAHDFQGEGAEPGLQLGVCYGLQGHPELGPLQFFCRDITHVAVNNLGALMAAHWGEPGLAHGTYCNRFIALAPGVPVTPARLPKPLAQGVQTATVVGVEQHAITSHRDHHVRVQFFWQRGERPLAGGRPDTGGSNSHAPGDETSGTWVPVSQALAGANFGQHFTPRIGSEVLVDFFNADIDQPVVVAQLYNGVATPPLAASISGVHTQVLDGQPASQWQLDDSPGQLRQGLLNDTAQSRLALGYLVATQDTQRGVYLGRGFAQSTGGWGQVRAGDGLLLSTSLQPRAGSTQMNMEAARGQLRGAIAAAERLDQAARQALAGAAMASCTAALSEALDPQGDARYPAQVNGQDATQPGSGLPVERFGAPHLVLETPADLLLATPASSNAFAAQQLQLTSQHDLHLNAGHNIAAISSANLHLYTGEGGAKVIAQEGAVGLQAHAERLELLADQGATFTATAGRIDLIAKDTLVLQAGASRITLHGADITFACPGVFSVKGSEHPLLNGANNQPQIPALPRSQAMPGPAAQWVAVNYRDEQTRQGIREAGYQIQQHKGPQHAGNLKPQGDARHDNVPPQQVAHVKYRLPLGENESNRAAPEDIAKVTSVQSRERS